MTDNSKTASHLGQSCDMLTLYLKACSAVYRVTQKAVLQASGLIHNLAHSLSHVSHSLSSLGRLLPLIQFRSVCMVSSRVQFLFYLFIYYYNFFFHQVVAISTRPLRNGTMQEPYHRKMSCSYLRSLQGRKVRRR